MMIAVVYDMTLKWVLIWQTWCILSWANQNATKQAILLFSKYLGPPPLYKCFLAAVVSKPNPPQLITIGCLDTQKMTTFSQF